MRVVAVGDSVMWGQGLDTHSKFAEIFAQRLGTSVEMHAHSGAVINPVGLSDLTSVTDEIRAPDVRGEIPAGLPTIEQQLKRIEDPRTVDWLLMTGGANDFGFLSNLAVPLGNPLKRIHKNSVDAIGKKVPGLIKLARQTCPNAVIIFTGYYLGVSDLTETDKLVDLITLAVDSAPATILRSIESAATASQYHDPAGSLAARGVSFAVQKAIQNQIILNNYFWSHRQLIVLREAVRRAQRNPGLRGPGILFVHPGFGREHALGAKGFNSHIYSVLNEHHPDPLMSRRAEQCPVQHRGLAEAVNRLKCVNAATFHPNSEGAKRYADRMLAPTALNSQIRVRGIVGQYAPKGRSLRKALSRHGMAGWKATAMSLRAASPHRIVDVLQLSFTVVDVRDAGTENALYLGIGGGREFHLTKKKGRASAKNGPEFRKGRTYHFVIDPLVVFPFPEDRGEAKPLLLKDIEKITLIKRVKSEISLGSLSDDLVVTDIRLSINGDHTIYATERAFRKKFTRRNAVWRAGDYDRVATAPFPAKDV